MKRILTTVVLLLAVLVTAGAATYDYWIQQYDMDIEVAQDKVYSVTENLDFFYLAPYRGFYRDIPVVFGPRKVVVENLTVSDPYTVVNENRNYLTLKIGDAQETIRGEKHYTISYTYDPGADDYDGYEEFYFNLIGEGWEVPIEKLTFTLQFPQPVEPSRIWFTAGRYGSTDQSRVNWALSSDGKTITGTAQNIFPGEAVTARVEMDPGYFVGARVPTDWRWPATIGGLIVSILFVGLMYFLWSKWGKDEDLIIMARYSPPEGLTPMDVGYLADNVVDDKDITSMIFYWADKGLLSITEGKRKEFTFTRLAPISDSASVHERLLFNKFFDAGKNGVVTIKDLEKDFAVTVVDIKNKVKRFFTGERAVRDVKAHSLSMFAQSLAIVPPIVYAYTATITISGDATIFAFLGSMAYALVALLYVNGMMGKWHMRKPGTNGLLAGIGIGLAAVATVVFYLQALAANNTVVGSLILSLSLTVSVAGGTLFAVNTTRRSAYGKKITEEILGYREFIDKVEMDKLKLMIDSDPQIFYHVLSYAIVLGLEDKWAKKFSSITIPQPDWYYGRTNVVWDALFFSALARRWNTAFAGVSIPKGSSSPSNPGSRFGGSSFGGSGFSGGGFGGGGGRAW